MKRTLVVKILAILLTLGLATSAAAANQRAYIDGGGWQGGGLSGAGTGNY